MMVPHPAFKEWEAGGVEEVAAASGHLHLGVFAAVMHDAEKGEELRPSAVALVHGVRVMLGVGAEPLEKPVDGVVTDVEPGGAFGFRVGGDDAPVFGEEQKNEPHEDVEQAGVNLVRVFLEDGSEKLAFGVLVGGLEAAQHFVEGIENLAGQLGGDGALVFAAAGEQGGQARGGRDSASAAFAEQHVERGEDGAACHFDHVLHMEGDVAGVLAVRGVDEADLRAVVEQADGNAGFAEKPLKALGGRGRPAALVGCSAGVEIGGQGECLDEQEPRLVCVLRARVLEGE